MRRLNRFILLTVICFTLVVNSADEQVDSEALFPDINGWIADGEVEIYTPDNLYEYINGAAESYLRYNFVELAALSYDRQDGASLTIDIYRHQSPRDGFGIYSQEKPFTGNFLKIGSQGYYEQGILNFVNGSYYVKISCFALEEDDKGFLENIATQVASKINAASELPALVRCFPTKYKIQNSEQYISKNYLGFNFLHYAYIAEYGIDNQNLQIFIIECNKPTVAKNMLRQYLSHAKANDTVNLEMGNIIRFTDPYYEDRGNMNIQCKGSYIWGLFSDDASVYGKYMKEIEQNLKRSGFVE